MPGLAASNFCLALVKPAVSPVLPPQNAKLILPVTLVLLDGAELDAPAPPVALADPVAEPAALDPGAEVEPAALDELVELSAELECTSEQPARPTRAAPPSAPEKRVRRDTVIGGLQRS